MNNCVILYGQVRTLKKTIFSIKKLFREILNLDIYVSLNLSDEDNAADIKKLIEDNLNPIIINFIYNNKTDEKFNIQNKDDNNFIDYTTISFEEYKKYPYKDNLYTIDELKNLNATLKKEQTNNFLNFPFNLYIEDKIVRDVFFQIPENKYNRIFVIRSDVAWFENFKEKHKYTYIKENGFREKTALDDLYILKLKDVKFDELQEKIRCSKKNVLGNYFKYDLLNLKIPNAHARLFKYEDLKKIFTTMNSKTKIKEIYETYPILYPHWDGELYQKRIYEYLNLEFEDNFNLINYCAIIREK
jgi:hypothetical protein